MPQTTEQASALCLHDGDSVAVVTTAGQAGQSCLVTLPGRSLRITLRDALPFGHKVAISALSKGQAVVKYGQAIGVANQAIDVGEHVHVHNIVGQRSSLRGHTA